MTNEILNKIEEIIATAEKFRNAYFFTPPASAKLRRNYEAYYSVPEVTWEENGQTYTAEFVVECSCRNVYAKGYYTRNGVKTTLTAVKNSYNRMVKESA